MQVLNENIDFIPLNRESAKARPSANCPNLEFSIQNRSRHDNNY